MTSAAPTPIPPSGTDRPIIDRVGAMIGVFAFVASITLAGVLQGDAWWINTWDMPMGLAFIGIGAEALLLALLPARPWPAFLACGGLTVLMALSGVAIGVPTALMGLVALFGVTLWTDRRRSLLALALTIGGLVLAVVIFFFRYGWRLPPLEVFLTNRVALFLFNCSALVVATWAVADQIRQARERRALQHTADEHAAAAAAHQEAEQAARGLVEALADRQRIAREMHDVVAHGLSVMIVQADGARFAAAQDPQAAVTALETIAATGRTSLAEMRRLLGVLRDDTAPLPEAPQPELRDIPALVASLTEAGRDVRLSVDGDLSAGSGALGLTAYRTVQESLTNVIKHASADATTWVTVSVEPERVVIDVVDDGGGRVGRDGSEDTTVIDASDPSRREGHTDGHRDGQADGRRVASGHGLRGMAERVELVGGQLIAGPDPRGGFRVLATLPLAPGTPATGADADTDTDTRRAW